LKPIDLLAWLGCLFFSLFIFLIAWLRFLRMTRRGGIAVLSAVVSLPGCALVHSADFSSCAVLSSLQGLQSRLAVLFQRHSELGPALCLFVSLRLAFFLFLFLPCFLPSFLSCTFVECETCTACNLSFVPSSIASFAYIAAVCFSTAFHCWMLPFALSPFH